MKDLKVTIINKQGEIGGEEKLSLEVASASPLLVVQALRSFLANQRRARSRAKTRAEVKSSTRKVWRQKGTGRARHGSRKAPIFVGGGVAHGPSGEQNYRQTLGKKMARKALVSALVEKINAGKLFLIEGWAFSKTRQAAEALEKGRQVFKTEGSIGIVLAEEEKLKKALSNLDKVSVLKAQLVNPYFIASHEAVLITKSAFEEIKKRLEVKK
jgi:large subunit ribosomal protein L4